MAARAARGARAIRDRLDAVEELAFRTTDRGKFRDALKAVQDLERLVARAALGTAGPRDFLGLKQSITVIPRVRTVLAELRAPLVCRLSRSSTISSTCATDRTAIMDGAGAGPRRRLYADGVDTELDELRVISRSGKQVIAEMEERERARTGIAS